MELYLWTLCNVWHICWIRSRDASVWYFVVFVEEILFYGFFISFFLHHRFLLQRSWQSFDFYLFSSFLLDFLSLFSLDFFESFLFWTFFCHFFSIFSFFFIAMPLSLFYETLVKRDREFSWSFLCCGWMDWILC